MINPGILVFSERHILSQFIVSYCRSVQVMCLQLNLEKERTIRASKRERERTYQGFYNFLNCILAKAFIDLFKPESQKGVKQKEAEGRLKRNVIKENRAIIS